MPTDAEASLFPFTLPSIGKKKITAAFAAGQSVPMAVCCCWPEPTSASV